MPDIADYAELIKVLLGEGVKYFALLLISILAIRFWRNAQRIARGRKTKAYIFASVTTGLACGVGYISMRHSLGLMYSSYGMHAFSAGNIPSAFSLFQTSSKYWKIPDAVGGEGLCLMFLNQPDPGLALLDEAKKMRKGSATAFEEYHEGYFYFATGKPDAALPLLKSSFRDLSYQWNITKIRCIMLLDKNDAATAARVLEPFAKAAVQEEDHAYIVAALKLAEGRTNEARAIVNEFYNTNTPPLLKPRFERLKASIPD